MVFECLEDLSARIDDPDLDVTPKDFLILKNAGPQAAGMPEAGYLPIPRKLARSGVTVVLHVAPEAAVGGPLAAVRNGDRIRLSVASKRIELMVDEREIQRRLHQLQPLAKPERGYRALYCRTVLQAPYGCDLDFLTATPELPAALPDISLDIPD